MFPISGVSYETSSGRRRINEEIFSVQSSRFRRYLYGKCTPSRRHPQYNEEEGRIGPINSTMEILANDIQLLQMSRQARPMAKIQSATTLQTPSFYRDFAVNLGNCLVSGNRSYSPHNVPKPCIEAITRLRNQFFPRRCAQISVLGDYAYHKFSQQVFPLWLYMCADNLENLLPHFRTRRSEWQILTTLD